MSRISGNNKNQKNRNALKFIEQISDFDFKIAFSCKVTIKPELSICSDRTVFIFKNMIIQDLLTIISFLTDNHRIVNWYLQRYEPNKTTFIAFTENTKKLYLEGKQNGFLNESIEWTDGEEDNFRQRDYHLTKLNPSNYVDQIPPELFKYLDFNLCLQRTDENVYIRHKQGAKIPNFTREVGRSLMKILLHRISKLEKTETVERAILKFREFLIFAEKRGRFNWLQINDDTFTVYI